jgi:hypothetical protein
VIQVTLLSSPSLGVPPASPSLGAAWQVSPVTVLIVVAGGPNTVKTIDSYLEKRSRLEGPHPGRVPWPYFPCTPALIPVGVLPVYPGLDSRGPGLYSPWDRRRC